MRRLSQYLLLAFVFSVPWQGAIVLGGSRTMSSLLGVVALFLTLVACIADNRIVRPPAFIVAALAFVSWEIATYGWSVDPASTLSRGLTLIQVLAFVWLVTELCTNERERVQLMQAFVIGCIAVCFILIWAYMSGQYMDSYRYAPSSFNVNESADTIAVGIIMAFLCNTYRRRGLLYWCNIGYIPLGLFAVLLTASRSGFVATCIAMTGVFFFLRQAGSVYRIAWPVAILLVFAALFFGLSGNQRLETNLQRVTFAADTRSLDTLTGRTTIWSAGVAVFSEHLVRGTGAGTFALSVENLLGSPRAAHNLFVEVAAETGAIGLLLLAIVLVSAILPILTSHGDRKVLYLILFVVLVTTALVANVATSKVIWFGLAVLSVRIGSVEKGGAAGLAAREA
jgi:O-antigen ligase